MKISKTKLTKAIANYCDNREVDIYNLDDELIVQITNEMGNQGLIDFSVYEIEINGDYWLELRYFSHKLRKTIIVNEDLSMNADGESYELMAESMIALQADCDECEEKLSIIKAK
jgi:hypothetical protein